MDALHRFLNRPVHLRLAGPRARRAIWLVRAGWVVLNVADWATTAALLVRGFHESSPLLAAPQARGGLVALASYKGLVIAAGVVVTWFGFRLWPRMFVVLMPRCELLVAAAVANNVYWLVRRSQRVQPADGPVREGGSMLDVEQLANAITDGLGNTLIPPMRSIATWRLRMWWTGSLQSSAHCMT